MFKILSSLCLIFVLGANVSHAASYAIAPFTINGPKSYSYLEKSIPSMISSRLFLAGKNEPVKGQSSLLSGKAPSDSQAAEAMRTKVNADFLVSGTITILGDAASIDISVVGKDNFTWQTAQQGPVNNLLASVQASTNSINQEVFNRSATAAVAAQSTSAFPRVGTDNSYVASENTILNPALRYQHMDQNRLRSNALDFESNGMSIGDFNNDGKNEIALVENSRLYIYHYENGLLKMLGEHKVPSSNDALRVRPLRYKSQTLLVLSTYMETQRDAKSYILSFEGNQFKELASAPYYLNVEQTNSASEPVLIGQRGDNIKFTHGSIFTAHFDGKEVTRGTSLIRMPKEANLFNYKWLPNDGPEGDLLVVIDDDDHMLVFSSTGKRLAREEEIYASSGVRVQTTRDIGSFVTSDGKEEPLNYYIPMNMVAKDLDKDGKYELITSKPISTAAVILHNYRTYSQGDIQALVWDGIGMNILWKTNRIKGTIADVDIADPDNDGVLDLVVNVNTYPGSFGLGAIRTMILLYPLDESQLPK